MPSFPIPRTLEEAVHPDRMALLVYDMQVGIVRQLPDGARVLERVQRALSAARDAGMDPHVVTNLGFPRLLGGGAPSPIPAIEMVDGIAHHRLDLGPSHIASEQPFDVALEEQAWLTARIARQVAPSIIHAGSGHRGYETALVGAALRAHIRQPLVYEVRSFFESTWSADPNWNERGEQYQRRHDAETAAMRGADHVVTIAEAMRDDIIARGVDPERVTVIPNGVDASAFTPEAPDPALRRQYGLEDRFAFGYVSNLDHPRENQELLVEATAILPRAAVTSAPTIDCPSAPTFWEPMGSASAEPAGTVRSVQALLRTGGSSGR